MKNIYKNKFFFAFGFFAFTFAALLGVHKASAAAATLTWDGSAGDKIV